MGEGCKGRGRYGRMGVNDVKFTKKSIKSFKKWSNTEEIAQWAKCLLHKPEDLSSEPQKPSKAKCGYMCPQLPCYTEVEGGSRDSPEAAESVGVCGSEQTTSSPTWWKVKTGTQACPLTYSDTDTHIHTQVHTHHTLIHTDKMVRHQCHIISAYRTLPPL